MTPFTLIPREAPADLEALGRDYISNSYLARVKRKILGYEERLDSNWGFMKFGNELHRRVLLPEEEICILEPKEEDLLDNMMWYIDRCEHLQRLLKDPQTEVENLIKKDMLGGFLDIVNQPQRVGGDLKTTSANSEKQFMHSMDAYDYWRQAVIYKIIADLDEFYFYAISKRNHKVYVIRCEDYPEKMEAAREELEFLLHIVKNYYI